MAFYDYEPTPMDVDLDSSLELTEKKPYRKKTIPKSLKMKVWDMYIGNKNGLAKCMCCNSNEILQGHFEAGHVVSEKNGGATDVSNLRPICSLCNKSMRTKNMIEFMKECGYKMKKNWYPVIVIE